MKSLTSILGKDINLKKVEKLTYLSYLNSVRLHKSSIQIFDNQNYGLAHFVSVIALEELGKAYLLSDFVWDSHFNGRFNRDKDKKITQLIGTSDYEEYQLRKIFGNHKLKQMHFIEFGNSDLSSLIIKNNYDHKQRVSKIVQETVSGKLEIKKQNSLYVGLPKDSKKIKKTGKIINPAAFPKRESELLIRRVHNELISMTVRMYIEESFLESSYLEKNLNLNFIRDLLSPIKYINKHNLKVIKKHLPNIANSLQ